MIQPESRVPAYYGETIADYLDYVRAALMLRPTDADGKEMISYTVTDFPRRGTALRQTRTGWHISLAIWKVNMEGTFHRRTASVH